MVFLRNDSMQVIKIKSNRSNWTRSCAICRRSFQAGSYRYEWRLMNDTKSHRYYMSYWTTNCLKCLITRLKYISAETSNLVKELSEGKI